MKPPVFEKLNNTRDLGGIRNRDGKTVRKNRLIRSGQLFFASKKDLETLEDMNVRTVVDLRSSKEREEKPNPLPKNCREILLPVFDETKHGITREESEKSAFENLMSSFRTSGKGGLEYMKNTYRSFIEDSHSITQYANFLDILFSQEEGAVLYNCTAGKDRTGFASALILELLDVDEKTVRDDYLNTNIYLKTEVEQIMKMLKSRIGGYENVLYDFFSAREEYLDCLYETAAEHFGSFAKMIEDGMGFGPEKKEKLKKMYLE